MQDDNAKLRILERREIMKCVDDELITDQQQGIAQPPLVKECYGSKIIPLTKKFTHVVKNNDFLELLHNRSSKRKYSDQPLSLDELAFLLWTTQGIKEVIGKKNKATLRMVPSAGARHPFETYLFVNQVEGLEAGLYHYLPMEHKLEFLHTIEDQVNQVSEAYCGQTFFGGAAVSFVWTVIPYRSEYRYGLNAQKYALLDAGHVCQNLYLASEAIGCGACAIGAYEQSLADALLGFESKPSYENEDEFVVYAASVGKVE